MIIGSNNGFVRSVFATVEPVFGGDFLVVDFVEASFAGCFSAVLFDDSDSVFGSGSGGVGLSGTTAGGSIFGSSFFSTTGSV